MAKVIEQNTATRERLDDLIEGEGLRLDLTPNDAKLDPDGAYGRPAERLLTKPIEMSWAADMAVALDQNDREAQHAENDRLELREAARNRELEREAENKAATWAKLHERIEQIPREQFKALPFLGGPTYDDPTIEHGLPDPDDSANPYLVRDASSLDAETRALVDKAWGHTLSEAYAKAGVVVGTITPAPVSYDAHGGEVDPATVRVLNAAEDRKSDPLQAFIERRKPVEKWKPDPQQHEMKLKRGPKL